DTTPTQKITYDNGSVLYVLGGPTTEALAGQAAVLAPIMIKFPGTATTRVDDAASSNAVIGRIDDLSELRQGERTLLDKLSPDLKSPKANWKRNSSVLREEMRRGIPIRDASAHLP